MPYSVGAVFAAQTSRGNRNAAMNCQYYEVILPPLPTGPCVANTLFLHGDVKARPYRVEDFRDTLIRLGLLPEVDALGAFQMNHVWAVTFRSPDAMKKMLALGDITVKERRCLVVNPASQDVRLKLYWLLHNVQDEDVRAALTPFGKVTEVFKERWRVQGITDKGSSTRIVSMKLKPGVSIDDLPHQLRVAGIMTLLVAPGRAPLCLRRNCTGHIRRECRVPRCALCRLFGHDESSCVRTYATVAGPSKSDEVIQEHTMDAFDAEETAGKGGVVQRPDPKEGTREPAQKADTKELEEKPARAEEEEHHAENNDKNKTSNEPAESLEHSPSPMDTMEPLKGAGPVKRPLEANEKRTKDRVDQAARNRLRKHRVAVGPASSRRLISQRAGKGQCRD
ncbi:uncharacterized protein [Dermacentor andersoni]|uniref:uncharacterized protein n=1 Tax=Dermacentor andersoni TaxID=34620 RepID=UPI002155644F|nr:uncharacterized protein LOC126543316 [Dermacentor andersoni]